MGALGADSDQRWRASHALAGLDIADETCPAKRWPSSTPNGGGSRSADGDGLRAADDWSAAALAVWLRVEAVVSRRRRRAARPGDAARAGAATRTAPAAEGEARDGLSCLRLRLPAAPG